jgi:hypothetical protein
MDAFALAKQIEISLDVFKVAQISMNLDPTSWRGLADRPWHLVRDLNQQRMMRKIFKYQLNYVCLTMCPSKSITNDGPERIFSVSACVTTDAFDATNKSLSSSVMQIR